jgi:hypothetical protein
LVEWGVLKQSKDGFQMTFEGLLRCLLKAREREEGPNIAPIRGLQRVDIAPAKVALARQVLTAPTENGPFLPLGKHICHQPRVASVAIRERMDQN